jgi:hypothetical protein
VLYCRSRWRIYRVWRGGYLRSHELHWSELGAWNFLFLHSARYGAKCEIRPVFGMRGDRQVPRRERPDLPMNLLSFKTVLTQPPLAEVDLVDVCVRWDRGREQLRGV